MARRVPATTTARTLPEVARSRVGHGVTRAFTLGLGLLGPRTHSFIVEQLHRDLFRKPHVVDGIRFHADPSSVGFTPHGEITGRSAADLVVERDRRDLDVLDICCGTGLVGLTLAAQLRDTGRIRRLTMIDINIFNVSSVEKTLAANDPSRWGGIEVDVLLSDALQHVPADRRFDLIVSNPPHFDSEPFTEMVLEPTVLGTLDADWAFHRAFYAEVEHHLTPDGEVWFLENRKANPEAALRAIVAEHPALEVVETFDDRRDPKVFWMIVRLKPAP